MKWSTIRAIAFDLDGTLVDSRADLCAAADHIRALFSLPPLPEREMEGFIGDGIGRMVHRALSGSRDGSVDDATWSAGFTHFVEHYRKHITNHTRPYPNVETALSLFKTLQLPLAVVTNKNAVLATELLRRLDLADHFSIIIGGDTLPEKKPSAMPVRHAADILGVDVRHLLMVGDSANDILAAKAAGAVSCGVDWGYGDMAALQQQEATRADAVIHVLTDIYDHIRRDSDSPRENNA